MSLALKNNPKKHPGKDLPLKQLAIRGSFWIVASYGLSQVIRLGSNLILTRLLFPEVFGLMALVNVIMQGLEMISDVGIGPSIIQHKQGEEPQFYNSAWTLRVIRGLFLWLGVCVLASPIALFYKTPILLEILPIAGLTVAIAGFIPTKFHIANRTLNLGYLALVNLASQFIGTILIIILAWKIRSIWALVAGNIITTAVRVLLTQLALPGPTNRFTWDKTSVKAIINFGKWIFLTSALGFIAMQGDKLILAKFLTKEQLGVYVIAIFIIEAQTRLLSQLGTKVAFPLFSHIAREEPHRLSEIFYRSRRPVEWIALPAAGLMITCGNLIISYLYDIRYADAGWMVEILGIILIFGPLAHFGMRILVAMGLPYYDTYTTAIRVIFLLIGLPSAFLFIGEEGGIWVIALNFCISYPMVSIFLARHSLLSWTRELFVIIPLFIGLFCGWFISGLIEGF